MDCLAFLETLARNYDHNLTHFSSATSFEDMHMDSYDIVDFLLKVEEQYGVVFDDENMLEIRTMQDVMDAINKFSQEVR